MTSQRADGGRRPGRLRSAVGALAAITIAAGLSPAAAEAGSRRTFDHVATFDVIAGNGSAVAEIIDVTPDGRTVAYTDADNESIGLVDIADPEQPAGLGAVPVGGEPTSLVVVGDQAIVGVNTSASFVDPSGKLVLVDLGAKAVVGERDLSGQPDSLALSPDGEYLAVVLENERDEDLNGGLLPQLPTGGLVIVEDFVTHGGDGDTGDTDTGDTDADDDDAGDTDADDDDTGDTDTDDDDHPHGVRPVADWTLRLADLSPAAANAFVGEDLEPEYVDINDDNLAVVTFQENNHLAVVDLETGSTVAQFSAGSADLSNVDTAEEDLINLDADITKRREPDAVTWIDHDSFATANEGDYEDADGNEGGSRGFTIFNVDGTVEFESAESFEHRLVSVGHYNEGRSENKGVEPESVEFARFGGRNMLFVGSERSNAVGVYELTGRRITKVRPRQILPTGIGPEGLKAVPERGLFLVSTEADEADDGIPTMINIYELDGRRAEYPMIESADDANGTPIPWVALSGLAGDPTSSRTVYAVSDSFLAEGFIYTVDVSRRTATIVDRLMITGASASLDPEGIAVGPDGQFWVGSEGDDGDRPNLVLKVDAASGAVVSEIELPPDLVDQRRGNGIEGVAVTGDAGAEIVHVAIQRAWPDEGDTDEVNTKIGRYDVATGEWGFVHYPLQPEGSGGWIGLSELTLLPDGRFAVIERDKGWGPSTGPVAELKAVYGVDLAEAEFRAFDDPNGLVTIDKRLLRDMLPDIEARSIWTAEKLEGLAVTRNGKVFAVTDNDGVDDAPGETVFLRLGRWRRALDVKDWEALASQGS